MDPTVIAAILGAIATIVAAVITAWAHHKKEKPEKKRTPYLDSSKNVTAGTISGGTVIQAERVEEIHVGQGEARRQKLKKEQVSLRFITEGIKKSPKGFEILFSVWNNGSTRVKLFEFFTKEYCRLTTTYYLGGQRSVLHLIQDETSLWKGRLMRYLQVKAHLSDYDILSKQAQVMEDLGSSLAYSQGFIVLLVLKISCLRMLCIICRECSQVCHSKCSKRNC